VSHWDLGKSSDAVLVDRALVSLEQAPVRTRKLLPGISLSTVAKGNAIYTLTINVGQPRDRSFIDSARPTIEMVLYMINLLYALRKIDTASWLHEAVSCRNTLHVKVDGDVNPLPRRIFNRRMERIMPATRQRHSG
jgi:hypothetical protein